MAGSPPRSTFQEWGACRTAWMNKGTVRSEIDRTSSTHSAEAVWEDFRCRLFRFFNELSPAPISGFMVSDCSSRTRFLVPPTPSGSCVSGPLTSAAASFAFCLSFLPFLFFTCTPPPPSSPPALPAINFSLRSLSLSGRCLSQLPPFLYGAYFLIPTYWLRSLSLATRTSAAVNPNDCGAEVMYLNLVGIPTTYTCGC